MTKREPRGSARYLAQSLGMFTAQYTHFLNHFRKKRQANFQFSIQLMSYDFVRHDTK